MIRRNEFIFCLLAFFLHCNGASGTPLSKDVLIGTYQVSASAEEKPLVPTNFLAVTLKLNADGSFVVTDGPASFFFGDPNSDMPKALTHGTWTVSSMYGVANVNLTFTTASWNGFWCQPVKFYRGVPRISLTYMSLKDKSRKFHLYLTKQKL